MADICIKLCIKLGTLCAFFQLVAVYADLLAVLAKTFKLYFSVDESEKCIVGALTYIVAGVDVSSTLTNDDGTCINELTVASLCTESL